MIQKLVSPNLYQTKLGSCRQTASNAHAWIQEHMKSWKQKHTPKNGVRVEKKKLRINFLNITQNKPTESNKILKASWRFSKTWKVSYGESWGRIDRIRSQIPQKARNHRILLGSSPASIFTLRENLEEYYAGAALTLRIRLQFPLHGYLHRLRKEHYEMIIWTNIFHNLVLTEFWQISSNLRPEMENHAQRYKTCNWSNNTFVRKTWLLQIERVYNKQLIFYQITTLFCNYENFG